MGDGFSLRSVQLPVADVAAATRFYSETLGWTVRFADGDRYAALDAGGVSVALAAPVEQTVPGEVSLNIKVADLDAAVAQLCAAGAEVVVPATTGEHEIRATLRDPAGTTLVLYTPAS